MTHGSRPQHHMGLKAMMTWHDPLTNTHAHLGGVCYAPMVVHSHLNKSGNLFGFCMPPWAVCQRHHSCFSYIAQCTYNGASDWNFNALLTTPLSPAVAVLRSADVTHGVLGLWEFENMIRAAENLPRLPLELQCNECACLWRIDVEYCNVEVFSFT